MKIENLIIGIGGNISSDDGSHPIEVAIKAINSLKDYSIEVTKQSSWYETEPIPKSEQPNFFNCIVFANTTLNELEVLRSLHEIEHKFGRRRRSVNEARVIDLDLIDYSNKILRNKEIIVPHPRAHLRDFVLRPIADIDSNFIHPTKKISIRNLISQLDENFIFRKLSNRNLR